VVAVVSIGLSATILLPPRPAFVWNTSASAPIGLYSVLGADALERGGTVVAWAPESARRLAAARGYLPFNVPLVKQVAAAAGDRVCASGAVILVNGAPTVRRWRADRAGRPLPRWSGCVVLARDELLLLMPGGPASFDGRYFGVTNSDAVVGRARLLWAA
jgi:conjugative transfer signal peptidase TraF